MELNSKYVVDLTQAENPADIVFELSNIIEKEEAFNKDICLKLGDITLNQSQLLSINSLINSINSKLSVIESESKQTDLAAATLGIGTEELEEDEEIDYSFEESEKADDSKLSEKIDENINPETATASTVQYEETRSDEISDKVETEISDSSANDKFAKSEEINAQENETQFDEKTEIENKIDILFDQNRIQDNAEQIASATAEETNSDEKEKDTKTSENAQALDTLYETESNLENILTEEKDMEDIKNWPFTKEGSVDIEEIDEVMTDEDYEILQMNTQYHKQTVRSGQVIKSNGNVVIIGDCHPGCEIHAAGDITVWGVLGGIAHAGCNGNTKAKIRALNLNAIQLRIADSYARRPDHINNIYVDKTNTFTPEEARNINGSIVILKINEN